MNIKTQVVKHMLQTELAKWKNGEIKWNVSNQFNESVLENALENLTDDAVTDIITRFGDCTKFAAMDIAYLLSDFDVPEIDSAWID